MPARPMPLSDATAWITEAALRWPTQLRMQVADRLGISPAGAGRLLQRLVALQWLHRGGTLRRPVYTPGAMRQVVRRYPLAGLHEDTPWVQDFLPFFTLPDHVAQLAQHAFTELLNNAIEHSGGTSVTVSMRQTPLQLQLLVSDDGRGIFDAIGATYQITDPGQAMLELAKGKLSTKPDAHNGRGLFFTARLADIIDLHANAQAFQQRDWQREQWHRTRPACRQGSAVYVAFSLDTERRLDDVLRRYSLDGQGYGFDRTVVPLQLVTGPQLALASRAQARRVALRLQRFRRVELDFDGLAEVGHGFADELLRVFRHQYPEVDLVPVNMSPQVAALVGSVQAGDAA
ncbi:ATP-binding protein [Pseudaquabacterium pictum]|uniref:Histidine kinase n=1 Tax=Pseudaquabacterium pictum TaxID=2315236 RepID=A0A480AUY0_9BURK|nr:ATP-binding protein [Rubrivivax pictus]GCL63962.1 histidine kinase [Rubrivivax pictus]